MAIFMGSTPTITVVISTDEVSWDSLSKVYLTFAQKNTVISTLNTTFTKGGSPTPVLSADGKTFKCSKKLAQSDTRAFKPDEDLDCQVDVITTGGDRLISKIFSFGVCKSLRTGDLS